MQLLFPVLYMAAIAAALPSQQCAGSLQCCGQVKHKNSALVQVLLGVVSEGLSGNVGAPRYLRLTAPADNNVPVALAKIMAALLFWSALLRASNTLGTGMHANAMIVLRFCAIAVGALVGEYNNLVYGLQANYVGNKKGLSDPRRATLTIPMLAEITRDICFYEEGGS
ncbi:hypothetical protein V492_07077 [Pseudogymnoascus sp. VKM F-4246]|nr:hypothetical protein V492_07077 [Pseudogymnoascus sp. VKM F-4246]